MNIGKHRDNAENRVIASVSLGAVRTFNLSYDEKRLAKIERDADLLYSKKWQLANGSLVVMQGDTQLNYKHEIPKEAKVKTSRISLTFRQLVF